LFILGFKYPDADADASVPYLLVLMQSLCEDIEKEHPSIQNSDIVTFFQVAQSITSFQFHKSSASSVSN